MKRYRLTCALLICAATAAFAAPSQIIIIRHGEKPASGADLDGQGVCRADALATVFPAQFGKPTAIYAMDPKDVGGSMRPIETVTPLARALSLSINHQYTRQQFSALVGDVMSQNGLVLICWEHNAIPDLVQAFEDAGWSPGSASVPEKWSGSNFSDAWILGFSGDPTFQIIPENVSADQLGNDCPLSDVTGN